jgi:serine/threonine protein kinase/WD40 repeat protein
MHSTCEETDALGQLLAGALPEGEARALREHLGGCARCQATLDRLSDHAELCQWAADAGPPSRDPIVRADLARLLGGLRETPLFRAATTPASEERSAATLGFLGPAQQPGDLGSLGQYRILAELGRGGMGIVLKAYDTELARPVALKVLRCERADESARTRFVREARAVAGLDHDHVVAVYAVANPSDAPPYLVMQYIAGPTLRERIQAEKRLHPRAVAQIGLQVAEGLTAAHQAGLVHRDIKPANVILSAVRDQEPGVRNQKSGVRGQELGVGNRLSPGSCLLNPDFRAKIVDFGLVRVNERSGDTTQQGAIPGTPEYMSPEQIRAPEQIDARSDIYNLGVTLYEALTGEVPFRGTPQMVLQQVLHDDPVPPRRLRDDIPRDLETICLKAMAKEPERRYQTAAAMRDDLRRWLGGEPIQARPVGRLEKGWRWSRRNPVTALLVSSVAVLLLVIAAGASLNAHWLARAHDDVAKKHDTAMENLRDAYLSQAQARRWSGQAGRRFTSLEVLAKAAEIRPGLDLRNEAIACMPLVDLKIVRQWPVSGLHDFDAKLERYVRADAQGNISVCRAADDAEIVRLPGFGGEPHWISFSPDGLLLAAAYRAGRSPACVQMWDLAAGTLLFKVEIKPGIRDIASPAFSPDSRQIAVNKGDGFVYIHALPSGRELHRWFVGGKGPVTMVFHPSEPRLAVNRWWESNLEIRNADSGKVLATLQHPGQINGFCWRPDGNYLAAGCSDHTVRIWDVRTQKLHKVLEGHQSDARDCVFNHAGDLLASTGWDITTRLWDLISGKQLVSMPGYAVRFSRDDRRLAYSYGDVRREAGIWEVAAGHECRTLYAEAEQGTGPWSVDIHPRGRLAVSASDDGVRLWDLSAGKEIAHLRLGRSRGACFDPTGRHLITSGNSGIRRWPIDIEAADGIVRLGPAELLHPPPSTGYCGANLSRDGRWLAAPISAEAAVVIDLTGKDKPVRLSGHPGIGHAHLNPDGRWVATGTQHGAGVKIWNARTGKLEKHIPGGSHGVGSFSPDGQWLVTRASDRAFQTWKVDSWEEVPYRKHHGGAFSARPAFSVDGALLARCPDLQRPIELIDVATGDELAQLIAPNPLPISDLCFSPDGSHLAVSCINFKTIQLWDLRAIRSQLADLKLDWHLPAYPASGRESAAPLRVQVVPD